MLANRKKDGARPPLDGKHAGLEGAARRRSRSPVTKVKDGVTGFDYAPKADAVFYTVDATDDRRGRLLGAAQEVRQARVRPRQAEGERAVRVDAKAGGKPEKIIAEKRYIREFAVTQDGKRIAMISAIDDTVLKSEGESRVDVWEDGKIVTPPTDVYRAKAATPVRLAGSAGVEPGRHALRLLRHLRCATRPRSSSAKSKDGKWDDNQMLREERGYHVRGYGTPLKWLDGNDA